MITIIYCHPYDGSFNHKILQTITDTLTNLGREYDVIDLYDEGFNPVLGCDDLTMQSLDELPPRYQKALQSSEHLMFIFPIWWGLMPAMLKGFIDRVFAKGIVYDTTPEGGILPCLSIGRTTVVTTSESDTAVVAPFVQGYLIPLILNPVGINGVRWLNCGHVKLGSDEHRMRFLAEVQRDIIEE